ncbi:MAG TPA: type II toxin-antitoxin system VapC family toxin [Anaerolineae bacterium]|nr:type II toxin-antitoxin system VapC family toxin [Anaerolineae bacterium]
MNDVVALLDVNVPMYAAGQDHPYKEACAWVMTEVTEGRLDVATDTEVIQEILYRYGGLQQWETASTLATSLLDLVPLVYPVSLADARLAVDLFRQYAPQGVKARDLIHVAVMRNHGLTRIVSTDQHFDRIAGIVRLDPQVLWTQVQSAVEA